MSLYSIVYNKKIKDFGLEDIVIEKLTNPTEKDIYEIIDILRKNKYKFCSMDNIKDYNYIITKLYNQIEKINNEKIKEEEIKKRYINKIINLIIFKNTIEDLKIEGDNFIKYLCEYIPLFRLVLDIHDNKEIKIKYDVQIVPLYPDYNHDFFVKTLKFLLKIINGCTKKIKTGIVLTIFDYIFRNISFIQDNKKLGTTVKNKLIEMITDNDTKKSIDDFIEEHINQKDAMNIWLISIENFLV